MDELEQVFRLLIGGIVRDAYAIAALPLDQHEAGFARSRAARADEILELGHSPRAAEGFAKSAASWTRKAVEIIRERGSLETQVVH